MPDRQMLVTQVYKSQDKHTSGQTTANVDAATVRPARSRATGSELRSGRAASMLYVEAVTTRCERPW